MTFCAIDFGTSNSAIALPGQGGMRLARIEADERTLPTAVFFNTDENTLAFGRAALLAYVDGYSGRLMRSLKSVLGSTLADTTTELGDGTAVRFMDVITLFLAHLKDGGQAALAAPLTRVVLGRPVFFVDDDPKADQAAQSQLEAAARAAGFDDIAFQYEPIAAALDYEAGTQAEQLVLVADIGGGTSDFSLVRVGPGRARQHDRRGDVLAHHGVHVAGTDYDRRVELATILPEFGYREQGTDGREIPSRVYFDLATWHLINTVYAARRVGELALMRHLYADARHYERLMQVVGRRLGHALAAQAEAIKIAVSAGGATEAVLDDVEAHLTVGFDGARLAEAGRHETERIVAAARTTADNAGVAPSGVDAIYFTGGSTGLQFLSEGIAAAFPTARPVFGDRLASVANGLGLHAQRLFGADASRRP